MTISTELRTRIISSVVLGAAVLFITWWAVESFAAMCLLGGLILWKEWRGLTRGRGIKFSILGIFYISAAIVSLIYIRSTGLVPIFSLFALVWGGDISAYVIGKKFGKHKIAPHISPGKSWEGLAASVVFCAAIGAWGAASDHHSFSPVLVGLFTATFAVIGLLGDMFESSLKRKAGVKDSGKLIPGHGGLFDRVDALMACAIYTMPFYGLMFYYSTPHQH